MMRQCYCFCRNFSPKRLVLIAVVLTFVYAVLSRNTTTTSGYPHFEPELVVKKAPSAVIISAKNKSIVETADKPSNPKIQSVREAVASPAAAPLAEDPKELENARQTLSFLNGGEAKIAPGAFVDSKKKIVKGAICPEVEDIPDLQGPLPQAVMLIQNLQEAEVAAVHPELKEGGQWAPTDCVARHKVAIIIPYRDRQSHLTRLLDFLIPVLQRQRLDFRFIVTEQYGNDLFNKGRIMNAAFRFAEKLGVDCVIFHDVDMFPQDDRTPYSCPPGPRHLGAFVSNLGYQLWYKEIVGGVLAVSMTDYRTVNGYSNMYWAWGGEDDDMGSRILSLNYTIERPNQEVARYSMLKHVKRKRTAPKLIYKLLEIAGQRVTFDGVNETDKWTIRKVTARPLYHHLYVDVGAVPEEWRAKS